MSPLRRSLLGLLIVVATIVVAGCSSGSSNLPAASGLLDTAGTAMRSVSSVHFALTVDGTLPGVPVQKADGDLNRQGQAKGSATITELGQVIQADFVLVDNDFYIKGPTGSYQRLPAALIGGLFDPTAILDPDRGVAKVLTSVRDPKTEATESVAGTDCYRITGSVSDAVVSALVPGIGKDVTATVWVATAGKHLPVRAQFQVPGNGGTEGARITVDISRVNAPVSVTAPA
jgi:lipoprotein LprG